MKKLLLMAAAALIGMSASAEVVTTLSGISLTEDISRPTYYLIKNLKNSGNGRGQTYAASPSYMTGKRLNMLTSGELSVTQNEQDLYAAGALWYLTSAGDAVEENGKTYQPVHIVNVYTDKKCIANPSGNWNDNATLYLVEHQKELTGLCIVNSKEVNGDKKNGWNNYQGTGKVVDIFSADDSGSIWALETVDEAKAAATVAAMPATETAEIRGYLNAMRNSITVSSFDSSELVAAIDAAPVTRTGLESLGTVSLGTKFADGAHFTFTTGENRGGRNMIGYDQSTGLLRRSNDVDKSIFTLELTTDGYYLKNEFSGKYYKHPTGDGNESTLVDNTASATVYNFVINYVSGVNGVGIMDNTSSLRAVNTNTQLDKITCWSFATNTSGSFWSLAEYDDAAAANAALKGAIASVNATFTTTTIGEGVGYYSVSGSTTYDAAVAALADNVSVADKRAAAEALKNSDEAFSAVINQPIAGHFYRFIGQTSAAVETGYLAVNGLNTLKVVKKANNTAETVFYYDGEHLVSLRNGRVIGKCVNGVNLDYVSNEVQAATMTFKGIDDAPGKYLLMTAENFLTSGKYQDYVIASGEFASDDATEASVDKGSVPHGNTVPTTLKQYYWTIEELPVVSGNRWLPIYVGDESHVTLYLPVAIDANGRFAFHTLATNGDHAEIVKTQISDNIAPANTPIYAVVSDEAGNKEEGCLFVKFNYAEVAAQNDAVADSPIRGSYYAFSSDNSSNFYTIGRKEDVPHFLKADATSAEIPGFSVHINKSNESNAVAELGGFKLVDVPTSISEIVAGGENGAKVIYDLQGRRVNRASKGIFIVNGVKTLVK